MKFIKKIEDLPVLKNPVITFGFFDGVHLGHQFLLKKVREEAKKINGNSVLITYWPHPRKFLYPESDFSLLYSHEERVKIFKSLDLVDYIFELEFNSDLAKLSAGDFLKFVSQNFNPKKIIVGENHFFGKNREGGFDFLKRNENNFNFEVQKIESFALQNQKVSSSLIREFLKSNEVKKAEKFLGRKIENS